MIKTKYLFVLLGLCLAIETSGQTLKDPKLERFGTQSSGNFLLVNSFEEIWKSNIDVEYIKNLEKSIANLSMELKNTQKTILDQQKQITEMNKSTQKTITDQHKQITEMNKELQNVETTVKQLTRQVEDLQKKVK
jgi:septal ring factor EnvC (AmiA/AmiB activator)